MSQAMTVYHGSMQMVEFPEIRKERFNKDFYWGFYCTVKEQQAVRWATRFGRSGVINLYTYTPNLQLNQKIFHSMTEEWLDFIIACRNGQSHDYDIVEGPMADDTIFNYIQDYIEGRIDREQFWVLAKFRYPTHQISFHTARALDTLTFERSYVADVSKK